MSQENVEIVHTTRDQAGSRKSKARGRFGHGRPFKAKALEAVGAPWRAERDAGLARAVGVS
jgi:hypothetical protein